MKINIFDKFILKAFPRLIYLSIALDPLTDELFKGFRLWNVAAFTVFIVMCIWEYTRGRSLSRKYGKESIDKYIYDNRTEYVYDVVISILGFVVCIVMHGGPWWFLALTLVMSTVLRFQDNIKRWVIQKTNK